MCAKHTNSRKLIQPLTKRKPAPSTGSKAINLWKLQEHGLPIPRTYTCGCNGFHRYQSNDPDLHMDLEKALKQIIQPNKFYAVRSSSNFEDKLDLSFAGQFESYLNVQGVPAVMEAIEHIWEETLSERLVTYLDEHQLKEKTLCMGVLIQDMVNPILSGVALSRNPVTGKSEIIIEAICGLGEQLLQKGENALRWVIKDSKFTENHVEDTQYDPIVLEIAKQTEYLKQEMKMDVDVEWVFDGEQTYFVQVRPISTLKNLRVYSNRISRDMLPGMIKPLVWSINIPLINSIWIGILNRLMGDLGIQPEDLAHPFFYRAYFNMGIFGKIFSSLGMPPDSLEIMMGLSDKDKRGIMKPGKEVMRYTPRILGFFFSNLTLGSKMNRDLKKIEEFMRSIDRNALADLPPEILFAQIEELKTQVQKIAFYNIAGPLLMAFHNRMLKQHLERVQIDFLNFDLMAGVLQSQDYDPNHHLQSLHERFQALPEMIQERVRSKPVESLKSIEETKPFWQAFEQFVDDFGHFSDSGNDFSFSPWRENPEMILKMIVDYQPPVEGGKKVQFADIKANLIKRSFIRLFYKRARHYRLLRDRVSSNYIFGYGFFRYYFIALGKHLVKMDLINVEEDIFYLDQEQIKAAFESKPSKDHLREIISYHKQKMEEQKDVTPPEVIYGDQEPHLDMKASSKYEGIPASAGFYRGPACVVHGVHEFDKVKKGDVLIIPFSDVGWTPLFPKAGAVVSESGGMLCHCAIVAREFAIPSVVSALGVMSIKDEQMVAVDASKGIVYIET